MFTSQPIGFVSSPYKDSGEVPKGLSAKHDAEGCLRSCPNLSPASPISRASRISS